MGEGDLLVELIKLLGQLIWLVLKLVWWLVRSAVKLLMRLKPRPLTSRLSAATAPVRPSPSVCTIPGSTSSCSSTLSSTLAKPI